MNNNSLLQNAIMGVVIIAITTAPLWIPKLFGINVRECECGVRLISGRFNVYCKSYH